MLKRTRDDNETSSHGPHRGLDETVLADDLIMGTQLVKKMKPLEATSADLPVRKQNKWTNHLL